MKRDAFIIDIDGTLLDGKRELNHALDFLRSLQTGGGSFLLATNSIKSHQVQLERFQNLGISLSPEQIYSPVDSINQMIGLKSYRNVLIIGSPDEVNQIRANHTWESPELIVLLDFEKENFGYGEIQSIAELMENGCPAVSASGSPYYLKEGRRQVDTGAFVTLLESVTGRMVEVLGKPSLPYFTGAADLLVSGDTGVTVIGDDWQTDITGAKEAGFSAVLVKSGKYRPGDENRGVPDRVVEDLMELIF